MCVCVHRQQKHVCTAGLNELGVHGRTTGQTYPLSFYPLPFTSIHAVIISNISVMGMAAKRDTKWEIRTVVGEFELATNKMKRRDVDGFITGGLVHKLLHRKDC